MDFSIINKSFALIIIVACLFFAYNLLFTSNLSGHPYYMQGSKRNVLALILIAYSILRVFRLRKDLKK
jgi:hypothetical protein